MTTKAKAIISSFLLILINGLILFLLSQLSMDKLNGAIEFLAYFVLFIFVFCDINFFYWIVQCLRKKVKLSRHQFVIRVILPVCFLFLIGGYWIILGAVMNLKARALVRQTLSQMDPEQIVVSIDGKEVSEAVLWWKTLKEIKRIGVNRSYGENQVILEITDSKASLVLKVEPDFHAKDEYWVYYPKYSYTRENECGKICSGLIDLNNGDH